MSRFVALLAFGPAFAANGATVDSYLCVVDAMTGFSFNNTTRLWEAAKFGAHSDLLVTRSRNKSVAWEVNEVGKSRPEAVCKKDFNKSDNLYCTGFADFRFNRARLRFLYVHSNGYWNDDDTSGPFKEGMNTPVIGIGKCSPL